MLRMELQTCDVMADDLKTCDKAPIVGVVKFKRWSFAVREVVIAFLAIILLVLCLIFLGVWASNKTGAQCPECQSLNSTTLQQEEFCVTMECMKTAARSLELMNSSVDPCDNFYEYACGNYKTYNPRGKMVTRTVKKDMVELNVKRLFAILQRPPAREGESSYEWKMAHFYRKCLDSFDREYLQGKPFLRNVVEALGGWELLGTWNKASWNFNTALKKVQTDFWVPALFQPGVGYDHSNNSRRVITLNHAGSVKWMHWPMYKKENSMKRYQDDYKKYIRKVGSLLLRDANLLNETVRASRLDQFVDDTFTIESKVAAVILGPYQWYIQEDRWEVSLSALTNETNNVIDWVDQISYLFNEANVNASTKVIVRHRDYFLNMTSMITSLPAASRKRMLHHYLIWRVAERYAQDLSSEYIYADRVMLMGFYFNDKFHDFVLAEHCQKVVKRYMKDALEALYVKDHFATHSIEKVTDITMNLKKALKSRLDKTTWMDMVTKTRAKEKLDKVTFKIGYPDWMTDDDQVDKIYTSLKINEHDYFKSILNANAFERKALNNQLRVDNVRDEWPYAPYQTVASYYHKRNEIIVTAGLLQDPIFNHNAPHFSTFGTLGTYLATQLHSVIDELGRHYDEHGKYMPDTWWSNHTLLPYWPIKKCVVEVYRNITQEEMLSRGFVLGHINFLSSVYAQHAIAKTSSIRLAFEGYRKWVAGFVGTERMLPGLMMNPDKMIFLSFAQAHCYNGPNDDRPWYYRSIEDIRLNTALGQLTEFSTAFQCKAGTKMNHQKKCDYY